MWSKKEKQQPQQLEILEMIDHQSEACLLVSNILSDC